MLITHLGDGVYGAVHDGVVCIEKSEYEPVYFMEDMKVGERRKRNGRYELIKRISNIIDFNK